MGLICLIKENVAKPHSATFVEIEIDRDLKGNAVSRAVTAVATGTIINPKVARNQILGPMFWEICKALCEVYILNEELEKFINQNLAEYHIPIHSNVNDLVVIVSDEKDGLINAVGIKGVGEIGVVAIHAAVTSSIYHVPGTRIINLPIQYVELLSTYGQLQYIAQ